MERNIDYTLLYRVAKAYYVDKKTQQEIADVENFSRSQGGSKMKEILWMNFEPIKQLKLNLPEVIP